jgi:serine/threonine protein kinase
MDLTVQNVYGLLLRSKLLPLDEARAMFERWNQEARDQAGNTVRFAAWMVQNRYLTEYQANLLARGHADGFFLNDYKILERLGKGRMAGVYKAQHALGQVVAIKVLPPSKAADPSFLARFQREAKLALRLKHPNIVRTFQVGAAGNLNYLVMEHLEGETLDDVLDRRAKLPPAEAARLIHQALQGLQHIHSQGLVHRDLKPANLMLVPPGPNDTLRATVKILDIGLGRVLFDDSAADITTDPGLTGEGVLLGTPDYMAPEQAKDARAADIRADVYSLGGVLYHCLSGQPPFPDVNVISQMIRHATEPPRPLKDFNPQVPEGLQQIVSKMLAKTPEGRYPTPEKAAQALQAFLAAGAEPASPDADPKMKPYLTWLEVEGRKGPPPLPTQAARAATPTVARTPRPPRPDKASRPPRPPGEMSERERKMRALRKKARKARKAAAAPPPVLGAAPPPAPAKKPALDVELVPMTAAAPPAPGRGLRRRDVLTFCLGALLGGGAAVAACYFAFRNKLRKPEGE